MCNKLTYIDVHRICDSLVIQIGDRYRFDYIVAVSRGGLIPGVILSHKMNLPLYPVLWSTRDHEQRITYCDIAEDLSNGKTILLVDDINDSGKTFLELIQDWDYNDKNEGTIITATLCDRYTTVIPSNYYGILIDNDNWVIFPWEKEGNI